VKPEIYRVAERYGLKVTLVAGSAMRVPLRPPVELVVVDRGFDAADDWIAERAGPHDLVVTADVLLAARCLDKGAAVLGNTGVPFTTANIGDAVATRNLLSEMRGAGVESGGPPPFADRDRSRFLQALDRAVHAIRRVEARP